MAGMITDKTVDEFVKSPRGNVDANHWAVEIALLHRQAKALEAIAGFLEKLVGQSSYFSKELDSNQQVIDAITQGQVG